MSEIRPEQLRDLLARGKTPLILDVREPEETRLAPFAGALEIPLAEIPERLAEIPTEEDIVVLCHHGIRSGRAAAYLATRGFGRVSNLVGGIDAWSRLVDPHVPRY